MVDLLIKHCLIPMIDWKLIFKKYMEKISFLMISIIDSFNSFCTVLIWVEVAFKISKLIYNNQL